MILLSLGLPPLSVSPPTSESPFLRSRYPTLPSPSLTPLWNPTSYPPPSLSNLLTSVHLPCCCPSSGHHQSFLHCTSLETPFCLKPGLPTVRVPRASQGNLSKNGNTLSLSCLWKPWTMSLCQMASSVTLSPANSLPFSSLIMCCLIHLFRKHFYWLTMPNTRFWEHTSRKWEGVETDLGVGLAWRL